MREIKFRQPWYRDDGKFSHFSEWGRIQDSVFASPSQCNFATARDDEQFTGLIDKNGKEIYEGDFLRDPIGLFVHWCTKSNGWQLKYPLSGGCACYLCEGDCELHDWNKDEIEVIGNIHENGDLLE